MARVIGFRLGTLLLVLGLLASLLALPACGGSAGGFSLSDVSCAAGEDVTVTVTVRENPGLSGIKLRLSYGDAANLTPHGFSAWSVGGMAASNCEDPAFSPSAEAPYVTLVWAGISTVRENGAVFTLSFRVAEDAPKGEYPLTLTVVECTAEGKTVKIKAEGATLTVK